MTTAIPPAPGSNPIETKPEAPVLEQAAKPPKAVNKPAKARVSKPAAAADVVEVDDVDDIEITEERNWRGLVLTASRKGPTATATREAVLAHDAKASAVDAAKDKLRAYFAG